MIPYYKLPKNWTSHSFFLIIGPEGLVSSDLFEQIKKHYPNHKPTHLSVYDKEDLETFKSFIQSSLIPNPEILFVRLNPKLTTSFPFEIPQNEKIIVLYGLEKPIKQTTNAFTIRTYTLKEPFKSKAISKLLSEKNLQLSPKGIQWLSLSHQNLENLIPNTIDKIKLTYQKKEISDNELKPLIYNHNEYPAYEILEHLNSKTALQLFISSQRKEDWQAIYWTLLNTWRKLILCQKDPEQLKTHFPWDNQKKQALFFIHQLNNNLEPQLLTLLDLEADIKGLRFEPFIPKLQKWLLYTHQKLLT